MYYLCFLYVIWNMIIIRVDYYDFFFLCLQWFNWRKIVVLIVGIIQYIENKKNLYDYGLDYVLMIYKLLWLFFVVI